MLMAAATMVANSNSPADACLPTGTPMATETRLSSTA